ncbi:LysR family transcriptional regulator [Corticibacter populi]|uniref:LysR family transcriptional regulator n=1 Tax=Corticibacter populi TaxID=1550736 RepID=A0A3M6QPU4_9BURK|nr:LysR family transcriptional regulator [Corticibacter populi]RMX05057.1 LysR family transcriptional regulator [Corticibacter populi]RZS33826.1 DNA-binding transcriptional LysR family regulator [Corticibacter populi]
MDRLKALETFVNVAARGSLTAAAKAEDVVTAIVSRRLDALEAHLGVKLLVRTTRRISLTREGAAFLEDCQRLLAELADAEANVSAGSVKATGHLRLTAPAGFGRRHVAPLVPRFHAQHPEVRVSLNLSDRLVDLAGEGYDCAVRVGDLPDSSLISVRLADNRRLCVAAPAYIARHGVPATPAELQQHNCLGLSSEASQSRGWAFAVPQDPDATREQQDGAPAVQRHIIHIKPRGALDCSDGQVLHDWCLAGHGIAWRSTWEVEADIASGRLVPLLEEFRAPPNGIYAVFPQRKHMPLRVRLWIDFLREQYERPDFWWRSPASPS